MRELERRKRLAREEVETSWGKVTVRQDRS
jgi:hypothetical protein